MSAIDELYQVQNGVDDVVDTDHNTLVDAAEFLSDTLGDYVNFGNGRDGNIKLGSIATNPTTAPTCIATGTGILSATYYYKYSVYNLSGETNVSSASATVSPSSQNVQVAIPAYVTNSNVTGFNLYRSVDDVTYYRVAKIPVQDATQGVTWIDEIPATSGTAPAGSNTTATSATFGGILHASSVTIQSGQTITVDSTYPYLVIKCTGDVTFAGTINGSEKASGTGAIPDTPQNDTQQGASTKGGVSSANGQPIFQSSSKLYKSSTRWIFSQGSGWAAVTSTDASPAGGTVMIAAKGSISMGGCTVTNSGMAGVASEAKSGGSGGIAVFYSDKYISRATASVTANGGAGSTGTLSTAPGAGGGGGGIIVYCSPFIIGSATSTASGGAAGAANPSGSGTGAGGGGCGGTGGQPVGNTTTPGAGTSGLVIDTTPQVFMLPKV